MKKIIFVCSPYGGDVDGNINRTRRYCRFVMAQGFVPYAPHLLFPQFLDDTDPVERETGISMGLVMLEKCSELWCFGTTVSRGMAVELAEAEKRGILIRRFTDNCEEVLS